MDLISRRRSPPRRLGRERAVMNVIIDRTARSGKRTFAVHRKIQQIAASIDKTAASNGCDRVPSRTTACHGEQSTCCHATLAVMKVEGGIAVSSETSLVIGAGIAGPPLGIALARAGMDAVVYESSPRPRDAGGAFLNLAPNGLNVLRALGADGVLEGIGFQNDRLVFQNEAGRVIAELPVGGITVMRGALSRALRAAAEQAGVRFVFGKALESIELRGGNVAARFADGASANGRCLIGTDGIHSRTRDSAFPDAPSPSYTGILNLGGIVQTDLPSTGAAMHMVFGHRAFFGYAVRPSGETYWFSNFAQTTEPARGSLEKGAGNLVRDELMAFSP
jgi:2-polyprenyl-6-methoxyphenol hydroxylase-like FAD-dependent oxidoreductase